MRIFSILWPLFLFCTLFIESLYANKDENVETLQENVHLNEIQPHHPPPPPKPKPKPKPKPHPYPPIYSFSFFTEEPEENTNHRNTFEMSPISHKPTHFHKHSRKPRTHHPTHHHDQSFTFVQEKDFHLHVTPPKSKPKPKPKPTPSSYSYSLLQEEPGENTFIPKKRNLKGSTISIQIDPRVLQVPPPGPEPKPGPIPSPPKPNPKPVPNPFPPISEPPNPEPSFSIPWR